MANVAHGAKGAKPDGNVIHNLGGEFVGKGSVIDSHAGSFRAFMLCMEKLGAQSSCRDDFHKEIGLEAGLRALRERCLKAHAGGNRVIFIGNGGSAAIASHMAVDWTKNGGIRAIAFNDAPTLTCLANDFGYENVFAKQLEYYAQKGDVVIIISSSGKSPNIRAAAQKAVEMGNLLVTFSGMRPDNYLRRCGWWNFWVPSNDYGQVELTHLILLHAIVSITWT